MTTPDHDANDLFLPDGSLRPELLCEDVSAALQEAVSQAIRTNWDVVEVPHVFMGLIAVPDAGVCNWARRIEADLPMFLGQFQELFHQDEGNLAPIPGFCRPFLSEEVIQMLAEARARSAALGRTNLTQLDLLIAIFATKTIVADCFERIGVSSEQMVKSATLAQRETGK